MVSEELLQQFEQEGVEYERRVNDNNDEQFWNDARIFPETIEYEIQDVYRLREKPVTPFNIFDVIGGRGGGGGNAQQQQQIKKQQQQQQRHSLNSVEDKPKEYLAYTYYVYYTNTFTNHRFSRDFYDGGIKVDAEFNYETDAYGNVVETYLGRYIQTYTIPFTLENLKDIFSNQVIEYVEPERNKKGKRQGSSISNSNSNGNSNNNNNNKKDKILKRKCPVINKDKVKFHIGNASNEAWILAGSETKLIRNVSDWMYLPIDTLAKLHDQKKFKNTTEPQPETLETMNKLANNNSSNNNSNNK